MFPIFQHQGIFPVWPAEYFTEEELQLESIYNIQAGKWEVKIDHNLAYLLLGCLSEGVSSDILSLPESVHKYVDNSINILKGDVPNIAGKYSLPYSSTIGPKPKNSNYTHTPVDQASNVLDIIENARSSGLLGDQSMIFNTNASFYPEDIVCYFDDSILVICWKEYINGCVCNCMEVKIADGSQIKRKLTGDVFNSRTLDTMTNMSVARVPFFTLQSIALIQTFVLFFCIFVFVLLFFLFVVINS